MLSYAFTTLNQGGYEDVATEEFENMHNLFAAILAKGISRQLKQGLYREYLNRKEDVAVVRGKIDMPGTIQNRLARKRVLTCEYDELSENNLLNQILKTTVMLLLRHTRVDQEYKSDLKKEMLFFSNVDTIDPTTIRWSAIRFQRNNIYIGDKEVVFGVDKSDKYPFLVSYCDYHNPFGVPWATESVGCDDYLEAMGIFIQRVQSQIEQTKSELSKFAFDNTVFTKDHCIPDKRSSSIVGKVVVINAEPKRYEYQHPAFQLVLADGGNGATGGRGNAVFGTCLATGEKSRWERYDVLGEIKPECMPDWAKEALAKIKEQQKEKKEKNREER